MCGVKNYITTIICVCCIFISLKFTIDFRVRKVQKNLSRLLIINIYVL